MLKIAINFLLVFIGSSRVTPSLPPGVTPCARSLQFDQYNACVLNQVKSLTPQLAKGVRSLNLPALDPLVLRSLNVDRNLEALQIKSNMSDVHVYGGSNYVIEDLRADPNNLTVYIKLLIPHVYVTGNYDVQGKLLLLPLSGAGSFKGNFTNTNVKVSANGKPVADKNGVQRIEVDQLTTNTRIGNGNIKLKDASRTYTVQAEAAEVFFNSNPRLVLDIANPIIEDTAANVAKALVTRALRTVTKEEILP